MNKRIKKIQNQDDYEKSSFKEIMEDMQDAKDKVLESLPKVKRKQIPEGQETTKEILYGDKTIINKKSLQKILIKTLTLSRYKDVVLCLKHTYTPTIFVISTWISFIKLYAAYFCAVVLPPNIHTIKIFFCS